MKRSGMQRKTPLRASAPAKLTIPVKRKCKVCRTEFPVFRSLETWCSPACGAELGLRKVAKQKEAAAREERKQTRQQKLDAKPLHYWAKRAEKQFNRFIRLRDAGDPCISCGTYDSPVWHAGHMYTVKARPDVRFHEDNVHLQCPDCNTYNGGLVGEYRKRVVSKIGQPAMDALVRVNPAFKKSREYYQAVEAKYKGKADQLERTAA